MMLKRAEPFALLLQVVVRQSEGRYAIADDGVHIRLDGISRERGVYRALPAYQYPEMRGSVVSNQRPADLRHTLRRAGRWEIMGSTTLRTT